MKLIWKFPSSRTVKEMDNYLLKTESGWDITMTLFIYQMLWDLLQCYMSRRCPMNWRVPNETFAWLARACGHHRLIKQSPFWVAVMSDGVAKTTISEEQVSQDLWVTNLFLVSNSVVERWECRLSLASKTFLFELGRCLLLKSHTLSQLLLFFKFTKKFKFFLGFSSTRSSVLSETFDCIPYHNSFIVVLKDVAKWKFCDLSLSSSLMKNSI